MRLDKLLAHGGFGSRKEVKKLISSGMVQVNGQVNKKVGTNVQPKVDSITVMGQEVDYQEYYYLMLNKPAGHVSAREDNFHPTVIDCLSEEYLHLDLFPVGRLDIDTTGLLILTNDGQFTHQLLSPKKKVSKVYQALIVGLINDHDIKVFNEGIDLGDFTSLPSTLTVLSEKLETETSQVLVEIQEGKFHQVKRMFQAIGKEVIKLKRIAMGPLDLDPELKEGQYRPLNANEINAFVKLGIIEEES